MLCFVGKLEYTTYPSMHTAILDPFQDTNKKPWESVHGNGDNLAGNSIFTINTTVGDI